MSDDPAKRPQSHEVRTSLVDDGWSDIPPSAEGESTVQLSRDELNDIVKAHVPKPPETRELPRYELADDGAPDSAPIHSDDATKRIAYAALLGGSEAGRGGPSQPPPVHEQPTLVGHQPLSEEDALRLAAESEETPEPDPAPAWSASEPKAQYPSDDAPLPSFATEAEYSMAELEQAAKQVQSQSSEKLAGLADSGVRVPLNPPEAFDDSDLTVRAEVRIPPEMFEDGDLAPETPHIVSQALPPEQVSEPTGAEGMPTAPLGAPAALDPPQTELTAAQAVASTVDPEPPRVPVQRATPTHTEPVAPVAPGALPMRARVPVELPGLARALSQRVRVFGVAVPLWLPWLLPFTVAAGALAYALWLRVEPEPAGPAALVPPDAAVTQASAALPTKSVAELAAEGDAHALERLSRTPEARRSIADAVAIAKGRSVREFDEFEAFADRVEGQPELLQTEAVQQRLFEYVADPRTGPAALELLSRVPAAIGPDLLYEVWTGTKKSNDITQLARELVYKSEVRARASDALNVALDFRMDASCAEVKSIIPRARDSGDWRSLHLLGRLLLPRGCGADKRQDCYPCLRRGPIEDSIYEAIKAVRSRPRPKL